MKTAPDSLFHGRLSREGWTPAEIAQLYSYSEEANPELNEAYALRKMSELRARVEARLANERTGA